MADARDGVESVGRRLEKEVLDGTAYWLAPPATRLPRASQRAHLLPLYDEYLLAYKDRRAALGPNRPPAAGAAGGELMSPLVIGGHVVGFWRRAFQRGAVIVTVRPFVAFNAAQERAVAAAARRYGAFLGMQADVRVRAG